MRTLTQTITRLSILTAAFVISTGCIIVVGPDDGQPPFIPEPVDPVPVPSECPQIEIDCPDELVTAYENEFGCVIYECQPSPYCQSDADCDNPEEKCLPLDPECGTATTDAAEDCPKACQLDETEPPVSNLCANVECEAGFECVVERHESPITGEITERAACVEDEHGLEQACFSDADCEDDEHCVFPNSETFDEEPNCMFEEQGICMPRLL